MKYFHLRNISFTPEYEEYFLSPFKIIKGDGILGEINKIITNPQEAVLIADSYIMKTYGCKISNEINEVLFKGEVCPSEIYRIKKIVTEKGIKQIMAMGGGKTMDIAKIIKSGFENIKLILVPTSCATCAAFTAVSVVYNENHSYMDTIDVPTADYLLIDYEIFNKVPAAFFAAGVADTLAKYYEIVAFRKYEKKLRLMDEVVYDMAKFLYKRLKSILLKKWIKADGLVKKEIADINIVLSGMVSTLGRYSVTSSVAHAISYAMTSISASRQFLHGEHVAMGLIIQESLLKNKKNLAEIESIFEIIDIPKRFSNFGIKKAELHALYEFYLKIKAKEKIHIPIKDDLMYNIFGKYM